MRAIWAYARKLSIAWRPLLTYCILTALPLRFSTEAQAIAELRARLSSTGLDEFLTMGGVKVTQAIVGGPVKSPWKLSLPGRKPFEGSFSARQADLGWKGLVKQAIKQGAVVVEKSK